MSEKIVEILCIGREVLDGRVVDTNSTVIAQELSKLGLRPQYAQKVDDDPARMKEAFQLAKNRAQLVLVCGGLGPTSDDRTLEVFAEFTNRPLEPEAAAEKHLEAYLKERNRPMTAPQMKQVLYPRGGRSLPNPFGTACGFEISENGTQWFFLPGPPRELIPMLEKEILPRVQAGKKFLSRAWITQFTAESDLQLKLDALIRKLPKTWDLSFQTRFPEVAIGLHAPADDDPTSFQNFCREIRQALEGIYWWEGDHSHRKLEEEVIEALKQNQCRIVSVESCTGGLIAERLTDVSGSSAAFLASWVTYANEAKVALGVAEKTLLDHGAVSEATAREMAETGLRKAREFWKHPADRILSVSVTGIAGPQGGSPEKPVGLCFMGLADSQGLTIVEKIEASRRLDRGGNRRYFAQKALFALLRRIQNSPYRSEEQVDG
jgi:nicotinamide-nucleotide amidase